MQFPKSQDDVQSLFGSFQVAVTNRTVPEELIVSIDEGFVSMLCACLHASLMQGQDRNIEDELHTLVATETVSASDVPLLVTGAFAFGYWMAKEVK